MPMRDTEAPETLPCCSGDAALLAGEAGVTALADYAAAVAHEINQPLTSMVIGAVAALRWLDRSPPDIDEARKGLMVVRDAGLRAVGIVNSLRSLARLTPPAFAPLYLEDIVAEGLRLTASDIEALGIVLEKRFATERRLVSADAVQLHQVVFNLVTNAIHAMAATDAAGRRLSVEIRYEADSVRLDVADSGCGMSEEMLTRVFQPFFTTKSVGMGIGLPICRSIVEAHGGRLEARSTPGAGSTFSVTLALAG